MIPILPRLLAVEFMHQRPPRELRARRVFEFTLKQRLAALTQADRVIFLCDSPVTAGDVLGITADCPVERAALIVNPPPLDQPVSAPFPAPEWGGSWRRMAMTDRWARIRAALEIANLHQQTETPSPTLPRIQGRAKTRLRLLPSPNSGRGRGWGQKRRGSDRQPYLLMPAHDAIYTRDLLLKLVAFSGQHAQNGLPAAVSPFTVHQHSPIPGADSSSDIIDVINAAFNRDPAFRLQIERGAVQGLWGKLSLIPLDLCGALLEAVDTGIWEDDLELDRAINALGYASRALWVADPTLYRQAPPVFTEQDVRRLIERHLHYSLRTGGSHLTAPLTGMARYQRAIDARFVAASAWADRLIAEEYARMMRRVDQYGASWVDWGAYRYVARPYDPHVEVWKTETSNELRVTSNR